VILCVTLNPLVDTSCFVDEILPVYRTEVKRITHVAGGKGTNVARALKGLGQPARAFAVLGGRAGRHHADLMAEDGLDAAIAWISGETRVSVTVVDRDHTQRGYFAPPPQLTTQDVETIRREFAQALEGATAMCICGSALGTASLPLVTEFVRAATARGIPTLLDTYGEALRAGLDTRPTVVKANRFEVADYLGRPLHTLAEQVRAVGDLQHAGAEWAILTLGDEGALFAAGERRWLARPPDVQVVNPVGSGDAMTAATLVSLLRGWTPEECFRYGLAAAVANVTTFMPCQITEQQAEAMRERIVVAPVAIDCGTDSVSDTATA
jgi:1-phosphofructokinase family hexose kinase